MIATQNSTLTRNNVVNAGYNVKLEKENIGAPLTGIPAMSVITNDRMAFDAGLLGNTPQCENTNQQISQGATKRQCMKKQSRKATNKPCSSKPIQELDYNGINSRLKLVFDGIMSELDSRNRTLPELLEEYDHLKQKNAMLQKDKDHFFHEMHEWKEMFVNIEKWRKFAFEALLELPAEYQALFIQKLHELEDRDREIQDRRMKELFASE